MAQIIGYSKIRKTQKRFTTPQKCEISDKFITRDGTEFVLHEFDSVNSSESISGIGSRNSFKRKRGRPRNDEINSVDTTSFDGSPESKKRRERKERRREKLLRRSLGCSSEDNETPKKRGRPRKLNIESEIQSQETASSTSFQGEFVLNFDTPSDEASYPYSKSLSGIDSRNSFIDTTGITEILNYTEEQESEVIPSNVYSVNQSIPTHIEEISWTPILRLTQLNQALSFANMYKDLLFWDRIIAEFINPNIQFRLEIGTSRAFEIPFIMISKFFWVNAQIGLHRLQLTYNGINELIGNQDIDNDVVLFNSSDSFIYSQYYAEKLMVIQRAFQFIEFNSSGKVTKWNIQIHKHDTYFKEMPGSDDAVMDEFVDGFPRRLIDFLDVALVMNSVLPDTSSWLTWFYTYIQRNGFQNIFIIELSRPPSPYRFITELEPIGHKSNIEFMERGQDFIFNILEGGRREEIITEDTEYQNNGNEGFVDNEGVDLEEMLQVHPITDNTVNTDSTDITAITDTTDCTITVDTITDTNLVSGGLLISGPGDFAQSIDDDDDFFDNYG